MKIISILFVSILSNIIPVYSEEYESVSITKTTIDNCSDECLLNEKKLEIFYI